jgi:hypothetical protein
MGIDYKFWDVFHSNFYPNQQEGQDRQMQYVDWDVMQEKEEPEFNAVIKACDRFELSDIMAF